MRVNGVNYVFGMDYSQRVPPVRKIGRVLPVQNDLQNRQDYVDYVVLSKEYKKVQRKLDEERK